MTDTNTRFNLALAHIRTISGPLADDIDAKSTLWTTAKKDLLSLGGAGYWRSGTAEQHVAVRALLLCTLCYYRPDHAAMELATDAVLGEIRTRMLGKSIGLVNDEIRLYLRLPAPTKDGLAQAALNVFSTLGNVTGYSRTRTDTNVGTGPVCYNGTSTWLFAAGFVSRAWLAKEGSQMLDRTARLYLGEGSIIGGPAQWGSIPRGHIFHIHKTGDQNTCHWGVSLGGGRAVACNNTAQAPRRLADATIVRSGEIPKGKTMALAVEDNLAFEADTNATYGIFQMAELCDILNRTSKYMVGTLDKSGMVDRYVESNSLTGCNIVVRHVDPTNPGVVWY